MTQPIPRVLVDPPALSPPRYGLLSVAQVVTGDGGGPSHWQYNGVEWQTDACADGAVWAPACPPPSVRRYTVTWDAEPTGDGNSNVTVSATVDSGDALPVQVTVGDATATVTTGSAGFVVATVPAGAEYPVSATAEGVTDDDTLTINADGLGREIFTFDVGEPGPGKQVGEGIDLVSSGDPFTVYAGVACGSVGIGDAEARARRRLALVEQRVAERHVWDTQITVGGTDLTPGGAVPLIRGIALLEQALAEGYAGTGVIHAPRWVAGYAEAADQLRHDGPLVRTQLDTPYAFGLGYGAPAVPGVGQPVRLYATGVPVIYRSDVFVPATLPEALDRTTNQVFVIAERTYVAGFDCGHWSVEVTVAELET